MLQANPFIMAVSIAIFGAFFLVAIDRKAVDTLYVRRIDASELPMLDGDTSDRVWRTARPLYMSTGQGGNFDDKGETTIEVRAVHDGNQAYFLFAWDDPTRSLKHLPLIKKADGWHLLHDGYEVGDEHAYNEDKFSVLLTNLDVVLAGDRTFHAGPEPIAGQPRTLSGRGLHYTMDDQTYADVWEWKATSTGPWGYMDDDHFGPPVKATQAEMRGMMPYHGGFSPDPGTANYADNFDPRLPESYGLPLKPRRLPKDLQATLTAMGPTDLDPSVGESEGARWFMTESESDLIPPGARRPHSGRAGHPRRHRLRRRSPATVPMSAVPPGGPPAGGRSKWHGVSTPPASTTFRSQPARSCGSPRSTMPDPPHQTCRPIRVEVE